MAEAAATSGGASMAGTWSISVVVGLEGEVATAGVVMLMGGLLLTTSGLFTVVKGSTLGKVSIVGRMSEADGVLTSKRVLKPAVLSIDGGGLAGVVASIVSCIADAIVSSIVAVILFSIPVLTSKLVTSLPSIRALKAIVWSIPVVPLKPRP